LTVAAVGGNQSKRNAAAAGKSKKSFQLRLISRNWKDERKGGKRMKKGSNFSERAKYTGAFFRSRSFESFESFSIALIILNKVARLKNKLKQKTLFSSNNLPRFTIFWLLHNLAKTYILKWRPKPPSSFLTCEAIFQLKPLKVMSQRLKWERRGGKDENGGRKREKERERERKREKERVGEADVGTE
jgi:hypothetical protein